MSDVRSRIISASSKYQTPGLPNPEGSSAQKAGSIRENLYDYKSHLVNMYDLTSHDPSNFLQSAALKQPRLLKKDEPRVVYSTLTAVREDKSNQVSELQTSNRVLQNKLDDLQSKFNLCEQALDNIKQHSSEQQESAKKKIHESMYKVTLLESENSRLKSELQASKNNTISNFNGTKQSYEQLGESFERKITDLVDENYKLKNLVANYQGQKQSLKIKCHSYEQMIEAYEERDREGKSFNLLQQELRDANERLESEKEEKEALVSRYELKIMQMENKYDNQRIIRSGGTLMDDAKQEKLAENLKSLIQETEQLRRQLTFGKSHK